MRAIQMIRTEPVGVEGEPVTHETSLLSEDALAEDWNRPEEDAAWLHLQPVLYEAK